MFEVAHICFCAVFFFELCVRILAVGEAFVTFDDKWWNFFDVLVVIAAIGDLVLRRFRVTDSPLLLLCRVIRAVRIVRVINVVPALRELKMMVYAIFLTFRSLLFALLLIGMIMYVFAILFTEAANQYIISIQGTQNLDVLHMTDQFGDIPRTVLTLFECFTGGISWGEILSTLLHLPWIFPVLFLMFLTFAQFALSI